MKWNKKTDKAIRLMALLADENKQLSSMELATKLNVSQQFIIENATPLGSAGLLATQTGNGGGYFLCREASSITMYNVIIALEDPNIFPIHVSSGEDRLNTVYGFLQTAADVYFQHINLQVLCSEDQQQIEKAKKHTLNILLANLISIGDKHTD